MCTTANNADMHSRQFHSKLISIEHLGGSGMSASLVPVASFQFLYQAEAAQFHLQTAGIESYLENATIVNTDWVLGNAVGDVKVLTSSEDAEAAVEVLKQMTAPKGLRTEDLSVCLACGREMQADQAACAACGWSYLDEGMEDDCISSELSETCQVEEMEFSDSHVTPTVHGRMSIFAKQAIAVCLVCLFAVLGLLTLMTMLAMVR